MEFSSILKTVAPWLASGVLGPLGGIAVDYATKALGVDEKTTEGLKKALAGASAEDMLKLQVAEQEFKAKMQEMGFKNIEALEALAVDDRKSARDMQKELRSWIPAILSLLVTCGFFGLLSGMMFGKISVADSQALLLMLGSLTTAWGSVMAFWFGSSAGGQAKSEMLAKANPVK